jgi:hypothetical protein
MFLRGTMNYFDPVTAQSRATFPVGYQNAMNRIAIVTAASNGWPDPGVPAKEFGVNLVNVVLPEFNLGTIPLFGLAITLDIKLDTIELAINAPVGVTMTDFFVRLKALDFPIFNFMPKPIVAVTGSSMFPAPNKLAWDLRVENGGYSLKLDVSEITFDTSTASPAFMKADMKMVSLF